MACFVTSKTLQKTIICISQGQDGDNRRTDTKTHTFSEYIMILTVHDQSMNNS